MAESVSCASCDRFLDDEGSNRHYMLWPLGQGSLCLVCQGRKPAEQTVYCDDCIEQVRAMHQGSVMGHHALHLGHPDPAVQQYSAPLPKVRA